MADSSAAVGTSGSPARTVRDRARPSIDRELPIAPRLRRAAISLLPLALGLAFWVYSVATYHLDTTGLFGLFGSVSLLFPLGLLLLILGSVRELIRPTQSDVILGLYLVALVVVIHATVPLIASHEPEYQWVYKHIGVIQDFKANGRVTNSNNIYQEWPALFAAIAGISSSTGVSPFTVAIWSPLGFELLDCLVLLAIFRILTNDRRVVFLGVMLFESIVSWVAQDYLSPEAFAYVLWFGLVLIVLRYLCWQPVTAAVGRADGWSRRRLAGLRAFLLRGSDLPVYGAPVSRRAVIAVTVAVFFVMVAAHQLAPYIALISLAAFAVLGVLRPRWLIGLLALIAILFLVPRYSLISKQYGGLLSSFDIFQNATVHSAQIAGSTAEAFTARVVDAMSILTWLATLAIVLKSRRRMGHVIIPAILAFAPFAILFGQSYGGEAPNRVFLFSVPWCAFLIAQSIHGLRRRWLRAGVIGATIAATLAAGLQGLYGPLKADTFTQVEIHASQWVYRHMPAHSTLITPDQGFPDPDVANADTLNVLPFPVDNSRRTARLTAGSVAALDSWIRSIYLPGNIYLVTSRGVSDWALYYKTPAAALTLGTRLRHTVGWTVFYRNSQVTVFQFHPRATH